MDEIDKLYNSWLYRHLSPLGRVCIIKSLALSKLSHIILVCPHLDPNILKELNLLSFHFLWKNKPDRMKRHDTLLPLNKGGLNMPDIEKFWDSLKVSWSRRFLTGDCAWQKVLQVNLLYEGFEMKDIWFGGPELLRKLATKLTNLFWNETIRA